MFLPPFSSPIVVVINHQIFYPPTTSPLSSKHGIQMNIFFLTQHTEFIK